MKIFYKNKMCGLKLSSLLLIVILLSGPIQFVHAAPIFGVTGTKSVAHAFFQVAVKTNASRVYVGYSDTGTNIAVLASSNNGTSFSAPVEVSSCVNCLSGSEHLPQFAVSGKYLYVTWLDADGNIGFASSVNNGATFPCGLACPELTTGGGQSTPHIAAYGKNVYVQWINNNGKVAFDASHDNGVTWDAIKVLSSSALIFGPQLATAGSNVYVTWEDKSIEASGDINTLVLSQNGTIVGASNNVSNTPGQTSYNPQIAAFKNNVYEIWQESYSASNGDLFFASSANNGTTFGAKVNLSNSGGIAQHAQIAANDSKVYAVWDDGITSTGISEVLFKASQNNGTTFGSTINLSNNSGASVFPEVALSGDNVYVVWSDLTIDSTGDVLFKASSDKGVTFGGLKKLNTNTNTINQNTEQISASSKNISTVWSDAADIVNYVSATYSPIEVQFDASQYSLNGTATITVTDPSANTNPTTLQTISIAAKSTTDNIGIASLTLTETGVNTGIFSGSITFTSSGSTAGTVLKARAGDIITATYHGQSSIASVLPITIAFNFPSGYDRGDIAHITVTDPFEHATAIVPQKITVHFTSNANPTGIDLQLTETGVNTYTFGSNTADSLIFMDTNNLFPSTGTVAINQTNTGANLDPNAIDTIQETVISTSDPVGITMNLSETGVNTGIFSGTLTLGSSSINNSEIKVAPGDILTIARGQAKENGMITPNPAASNGTILVTADPTVDTVTASYGSVTKSVPVSKLFNPGGSGGGLVRPGLVLNVLASLLPNGGSSYVPPTLTLNGLAAVPGGLPDNIRNEVLNHDPLKPMLPSNDNSFDFPFTIDGGGYVLAGLTNTITTQTEKIGTPSEIKLDIQSSTLTHIALYTNLRGTARDIDKSDTYIVYDKDQPLQIVDPHGYFANVKFDLTKTGIKNMIDYKITFAKTMEKSDIDLRVWDEKRASSENRILDAWQVEPSSSTAPSQTGPLTTVQDTTNTSPPAIQNTAPVPENPPDLMPAIKDWGGYSPNPISDSDLLAKMGIEGQHIPTWVAKTTKWIVDGDLTVEEFENMVKYLATTGTIK